MTLGAFAPTPQGVDRRLNPVLKNADRSVGRCKGRIAAA